jgi:hypothetical protein
MKRKQPAAVLLFAMVMMGIITLLTQQLFKSVSVGLAFSRTMVHRERAEMLALGGLSIAFSQLEGVYEKPDKKKGKEAQKQFSFKKAIERLCPILDRWQVFELKEEYDGVDGELKIALSAEEGKIPLSLVFDEPQREMTKEMQLLFKEYAVKKKFGTGEFLKQGTTFFKKRSHKLDDVSQLAPLAHDLKLSLFYEPEALVKDKKQPRVPAEVAMQGLFSSWSNQKAINPLFMSDSLCAVLGVRRPAHNEKEKRQEQYKQLAESYEKVKTKTGEELWKVLSAMYEQRPKVPKELDSFFSLVIEPRFYSVLSSATVSGVTQTLCAVVERVVPAQTPSGNKQDQSAKQQKKGEKQEPLCKVRRLYWV